MFHDSGNNNVKKELSNVKLFYIRFFSSFVVRIRISLKEKIIVKSELSNAIVCFSFELCGYNAYFSTGKSIVNSRAIERYICLHSFLFLAMWFECVLQHSSHIRVIARFILLCILSLSSFVLECIFHQRANNHSTNQSYLEAYILSLSICGYNAYYTKWQQS